MDFQKNKKIKVLLVNTLYPPFRVGGAEISVQLLAEQLSKNNIQVGIMTLTNTDDNYEEIKSIRIWRLKIKNIYWPFSNNKKPKLLRFVWHLLENNINNYVSEIKNIIFEFKPDIIHTNNLQGLSTNIWTVASKLNIPIVHTIRDYYLMCPKATMFKRGQNCKNQCVECKILTLLKKHNTKKINQVVGISNYVLKKHLDLGFFNKSKNIVIYNGFKNSKKIIKTKPVGNQLVVGYIGQMAKHKGIEILFNSVHKINTDVNWKLILAGKINDETTGLAKGLIKENKVEFLGYTESKIFYAQVDLLIVPSIWDEPFGRVVIEAIANKTPVLASSIGGIPELLTLNKDFLFAPNADSLQLKLNNLIENKSVLLEKFDFSYDERFKITYSVNQYIKTYKSLLS